MDLEPLDSNSENGFVDKKLMKLVNDSLSMFDNDGAGRIRNKSALAIMTKENKTKDVELTNVSEMISKMLGGDLDEKGLLEFKLGLIELIDGVESKYIKSAGTRAILNKVIFMFLSRFQAK